MIRVLLSNTAVEIRPWNVKTSGFAINKSSPQRYGTSVILFNIYLEDSLRSLRAAINENAPNLEQLYATISSTILPEWMVYNDDIDILSKEEVNKVNKGKVVDTINNIFLERCLMINNDKTEHSLLKQGDKNTKIWRSVKKLGSLLK